MSSKGVYIRTWQIPKSEHLNGLKLTTKSLKQRIRAPLATTTIERFFWILVAIINVAILSDLLLNAGKISVDLLFLFTGGYGGR